MIIYILLYVIYIIYIICIININGVNNNFMEPIIEIEGYELLSQKIYKKLKEEISRGSLKPGMKLYASKISDDLNVSITPVREALQRLASDGLLDISPNKAMVVKEVSIETVKAVLQVRGALDGLAAYMSASKINESEKKELEKIVQKMKLVIQKNDISCYCNLDTNFHNLIYEISGNKMIVQMIEYMKSFLYRYRYKSYNIKGRMEKSFQEHCKILESLIENNSKKAEQISKEHMNNTIKIIEENIDSIKNSI